MNYNEITIKIKEAMEDVSISWVANDGGLTEAGGDVLAWLGSLLNLNTSEEILTEVYDNDDYRLLDSLCH